MNSGPGSLVVNVGSTSVSAGQRDHRRQRRARALGVEHRQVVAQRGDQQGEADDAVDGEHHGREDGVARQRRARAPGRPPSG